MLVNIEILGIGLSYLFGLGSIVVMIFMLVWVLVCFRLDLHMAQYIVQLVFAISLYFNYSNR